MPLSLPCKSSIKCVMAMLSEAAAATASGMEGIHEAAGSPAMTEQTKTVAKRVSVNPH